MSRLQVGGLALLLKTQFPENEMATVRLIKFIGNDRTHFHGARNDYWQIDDHGYGRRAKGNTGRLVHPAQYLIPLGDDKGIELYGLREEIMTGHDKEAV